MLAAKLAVGLDPNSKPFMPFGGSGMSTPGTVVDATAPNQYATAATIMEAAQRLTPRTHSQVLQKFIK